MICKNQGYIFLRCSAILVTEQFWNFCMLTEKFFPHHSKNDPKFFQSLGNFCKVLKTFPKSKNYFIEKAFFQIIVSKDFHKSAVVATYEKKKKMVST